jgi:hypothetical protein
MSGRRSLLAGFGSIPPPRRYGSPRACGPDVRKKKNRPWQAILELLPRGWMLPDRMLRSPETGTLLMEWKRDANSKVVRMALHRPAEPADGIDPEKEKGHRWQPFPQGPEWVGA